MTKLLNELVAANERASNRLVNVEGMTEEELEEELGEVKKTE